MKDPLDLAMDELFGTKRKQESTNLSSRIIVWDIETGPLGKAEVEQYYTPLPPPAEFDPASVKCGNLGAEKAALKRAKAAAEHELLLENHKELEAENWIKFTDSCALSPFTGRVLTSQYLFADRDDEIQVDEAANAEAEAEILASLWERVNHCQATGGRIIGFNIAGFDLPFCIQRSWKLGLTIPTGLLWKNRYLSDTFIDLFDIWKSGRTRRWTDSSSNGLDTVCQFLGIGKKTMDGKDFWRAYSKTKTRATALNYARRDVEMEAALARRLGVL